MNIRPWTIAILAALVVLGAGCSSNGTLRVAGQNRLRYPETSSSSSVLSREEVYLPILVYHVVRPPSATDSTAVRDIAITPEAFDAQLAHLKVAGYHVIGFHALESYFEKGVPLPSKPLILTFDDGWRSQYEYAFPILRKYRDTATFFVATDVIGDRGFLTWDNLHALLAAGMTIGSHSRSHPFLLKITDSKKVWNEIYGSKELLEKRLGISVNEFAYPFGQYDAHIVNLVRRAGYKSARIDDWDGNRQTLGHLYTLSALNASMTMELFDERFP